MESTIKHIVINTVIPKGVPIADLSRRYPEVSFSITNGHWISDNERILYITCKNWREEYFYFLKKHKFVKNINQIGNIIKIQIEHDFLKKIEQKEVTVLYPTQLKNGLHRIEFLVDISQLELMKKYLTGMKVLKITDSYKVETKLTERQEEVLLKAYSFGYFKYPREITLTDLAKLLKMSKATLSQILRTIESKAIKKLLEK